MKNFLRKSLSILCYWFAISAILIIAMPRKDYSGQYVHNFAEIPLNILLCYIFYNAGRKLWTNDFSRENLFWKFCIYVIEFLIAGLFSSLIGFVIRSQFVTYAAICIIWGSLAEKYKPSIVIEFLRKKINNKSESENNANVVTQTLTTEEGMTNDNENDQSGLSNPEIQDVKTQNEGTKDVKKNNHWKKFTFIAIGMAVVVAAVGLVYSLFFRVDHTNEPRHYYAEIPASETTKSAIYHSTMSCGKIVSGIEMDKYWCKSESITTTYCAKCMSEEDILACKDSIADQDPLTIEECIARDSSTDSDEIVSYASTYMYPEVYISSRVEGSHLIQVKLFDNDGNLSYNKSISPEGYTYEKEIYTHKDSVEQFRLTEWGNVRKGFWDSGRYRFEFYNKGTLIGKKNFRVK